MKKWLFAILAGILFFKLVSAQFDFIFILFFAVVFYAINRFFIGAHGKGNRGISVIVAIVFAFFASSYIIRGDYFSGLSDIFNNNILIYVFVLVVFIFVLWKFGAFKKRE